MAKEWRVLFLLEYQWRVFRFYRKVINWLVKRGLKLSSPLLCTISKRSDNHGVVLYEAQKLYEKQTGKVIVYYKINDI